MTSTLWSIGDSWAEGWGLSEHEQNYSELLASKLDINLNNVSMPGRSLGEIAHVFLRDSSSITENDIVLITVPPDSRWYRTPNGHEQVLSALFSTQPGYDEFLKLINANVYWFTWHHSLFLFAIHSYARRIGCRLLMQHNYGKLNIIPEVEFVLDNFLDAEHSMTHWLIGSDSYEIDFSQSGHCGPGYDKFKYSEYFLKNDTHPNQLGHQVIADKLYTLITEKTAQ